MSLHVLHGGGGYRYLTRSVATGDVPRAEFGDLSDHYHATGTPPGVWFGRGAELLGVSGEVTEAQMQSLFGAGMHPDAEQIIAAATTAGASTAQAEAAARLGSAFYAFRGAQTPIGEIHQRLISAFSTAHERALTGQEWTVLRREAAREHLTAVTRQDPTPRQIQQALAGERRRLRRAVAAYDCTFTPAKSIGGVLFALGSDEIRRVVWQAHMEAMQETLTFAEGHYALARRGRGGTRNIDTDGLTVALYTHWDNRAGDPDLHTHAVISAKCRGADGKWSFLNGNPLHAAATSLSCRYNAILTGKLTRRLGLRFEERYRGRGRKPVVEVAGVPEELIQLFSRRSEIETLTEQLVLDYRRQHGRSPSKSTQIQLAQQATLATRSGKPVPRSLAAMLTEWDARASSWLAAAGDRRSGRAYLADLLDRNPPSAPLEGEHSPLDVEAIATEVIEIVAYDRATWTETHIRAAVEHRLACCWFADDDGQRAAVEQVVELARDHHSIRLTVEPDPVPAALRRRNGDSVFDPPSATTVRYTSKAVLDAEAALQSAAHEPTPQFLTRAEVTTAIAAVEQTPARKRNRLTVGQVRVVEHLCTTGTQLAVAIGPAGAGKTTTLRAVVRAWLDAQRPVIALSPQKSAAKVLAEEIGLRADTVAALLWAHRNGTRPPITAGTMIIIDEAGMASTADLAAIQDLATETGAVVRWVGDPFQLSAVQAGGALRLLAADTRAPELDQVVRFSDPAEAAATLHVRNGVTREAWLFYRDHDRVRSGLAAELREQMLTAHLRDLDDGASSLMMAATLADVHRLNGAAQNALAARGHVDRSSRSATLSDGHRGYVGDLVLTRRNKSRLRVAGGSREGSPVTNGDRWRVSAVHADGSLTVVGLDHRGRIRLPAWYVRADVELGYCVTVHRAQGVTVDRAHLLMGSSLGRSLAYVGLSRGRHWNGLYLATDTLPGPPPPERPPEPPSTAEDLFGRVLARRDDNLAATEVMREELARLEDPQRLREIYDHACRLLGHARVEGLLDRALPAVLYRQVRRGAAFDALADTLTAADQQGIDIVALIGDITGDGGADEHGLTLLTARDAADVLCARATRLITTNMARHIADIPETVTAAASLVAAPQDASAGNGGGRLGGGLRSDHHPSDRVTSPGVPPVPSRYPGVDADLADYALRLRTRLLDAGLPPAPLVRAGQGEDSAEDGGDTEPTAIDPRARLLADYEFYAQHLTHDYARFLLDRALPAVVSRHVAAGGSWRRLLDVVVVAEGLHLDAEGLVAAITDGDLEVLLNDRDAAAILCARAEAWIADHAAVPTPLVTAAAATMTELSYTDAMSAVTATCMHADVLATTDRTNHSALVQDRPHRDRLQPIPPPHRGMDVAIAEHADRMWQQLWSLPADAADWRARAASRARFAASVTSQVDAAEGEQANVSGDDPGWIGLDDAHVEQAYPELDHGARLIRLRAELAAAQQLVALLNTSAMDGSSPHHRALDATLARVQDRAEALAPMVRRARVAHGEWEQADLDAAAAEDRYRLALHRSPEAADEQWLNFLAERVATCEDPAMRNELTEMLDHYRTAVADTAQTAVSADIAQAKLVAEDARRWAQLLRADADAARDQLIVAAGDQLIVDHRDASLVAGLATDLAIADLAAARAGAHRVQLQLTRARTAAIDEFGSAAGDPVSAAAEADSFQPSPQDINAALTTVLGRKPPPDDPSSMTAVQDNVGVSVDAVVAAARVRHHDIVAAVDADAPPSAFDADNWVVRVIRNHADVLIPLAVSAHDTEQAWRHAEIEAVAEEAAHTAAQTSDPDPWLIDEPFQTTIEEAILARDDDPAVRAQLSEMLVQYRAAASATAEAKLRADRACTARTAAVARARADRLRSQHQTSVAELETAIRATEFAASLDLADPSLTDTLPNGEDRSATSPPVVDPDAGAAPIDEHRLAEQMRADPIRLRTDADLAVLIRALRHAYPILIGGVDSADVAQQVREDHAQLAEQVAAIEAAQAALAADRTARDNTEQRAAADAAVAAAVSVGAPSHLWAALVDRARNSEALAAELKAAELADQRAEHLRQRSERRAARAAAELAAVLAEHDRRNCLPPVIAAAEHRIRAAHPHSPHAGDAHADVVVNEASPAQTDTVVGL